MVSDYAFVLEKNSLSRLNPCCNGIWSQTFSTGVFKLRRVLILVVMEYGLRQNPCQQGKGRPVLILVVMEYGLRLMLRCICGAKKSLNPCCNGIWSQTLKLDL